LEVPPTEMEVPPTEMEVPPTELEVPPTEPTAVKIWRWASANVYE
jgi:hypothetical protein